MGISKQKFREIVFQFLYTADFVGVSDESLFEEMKDSFFTDREEIYSAYQMALAVFAKKDEIDSLIKQISENYEMERIPHAERNILRLSVFEMRFICSIPYKIAIAEAIRLCRKYVNPESSSFVNAILDSLKTSQ